MEFNELSPALMQRFMAAGELPNFSRLYRECQIYTTDAQAQPPYLNPWIQWVTVHSGLPHEEHRVFELGEANRLQLPCLWDTVHAAGGKSWVCGAMNVRYDEPLRGWVLPDPWTVDVQPEPAELLPYFRFVQRHVQEYTNERVPLTRGDYLRFMAFMWRHGLSPSTLFAIARQLLAERFAPVGWKRAVLLDRLQFDLFRWYQRREQPQLSLYFINSTAHFQHKYWRNLEPEKFSIPPSEAEQREYRDAVLFGYREMDALVARFRALAGQDALLIFATALSQQPCLAYEDDGGKTFYRPRDLEQFVRLAGVPSPFRVSPVMSEQFHVFFATEDQAKVGHTVLASLRVDGRPLLRLEQRGAEVFAGCGIFAELPPDALLTGAADGRQHRFRDVFYHVEGIKSGMHHPDGMLWVRDLQRDHRVHADKLPLAHVAARILASMGLPKPPHMHGEPLPL